MEKVDRPGPGAWLQARRLRSAAFTRLADPGYLIGPRGDILEANPAGRDFLEALPPRGCQGSVGRQELSELFRRAATAKLEPSPFRVEGPGGSHYFEARFGPADPEGRKAASLSDVSIWKKALAEKDLLIRAIRSEAERPVAVCARCGAVKDGEGQWSRPGALAQAGIPQDRLSHGLCQVCLAEELGHAGLGESAIADALAQGGQPQGLSAKL